MAIRSQKDLVAGALFVAIGLFFAIASLEYRLGTLARMGPGFFPLLLGSLLVLLGIGVIVTAFGGDPEEDGKLETLNLRGLSIVVVATLAFALLIQSFGLLLTLVICSGLTSLAGPGAKLKTILINMAVQLVIGFGIFHLLLKLQIPLLPVFLGQ
jgi:hypothetical protein